MYDPGMTSDTCLTAELTTERILLETLICKIKIDLFMYIYVQ